MSLNIFADKGYLPSTLQHFVMFYPFWGKNHEDPTNPNSGRYDEYTSRGSRYFSMTTLEEAHITVLPFEWGEISKEPEAAQFLAEKMAQVSASQGKPLVIFCLDDSTTPIAVQNSLVFRTSLLRSTCQPNDFVIPAWSEDFVSRYCQGEIKFRSKSQEPTVAYCGYDSLCAPKSNLRNRLRMRLGAAPTMSRVLSKAGVALVKHPLPWLYGSRIRAQALYNLSRTPGIKCNFIIRDSLQHNSDLSVSPRQQFVENMLSSDYVLCTRGGGNFSYRFYETLSCGRIPLFVNTDCSLPFEQYIDWKKYCVWVEEEDLPHLGKIISEFHAGLSNQEFQDMQSACRQLWLDWLSPQGFFANFHRYFSS
jgi:Exostosin family